MAANLFALLLGLAFAYVGNAYAALARRMRSFESVPGRVVARAVVVIPSGDRTTGRWGQGGGYTPQVRYRYTVDGVELEGDKIGRAVRGYKQSIAARKLAEIPDDVVVWYDPKRPHDAYLLKHGPALGYAILALGLCLMAAGVIGLATR